MSITFASLGVHPDLSDALAAQGITEPFAIQAMTIADALAGHDVCGKARTGSGKTLAFGLPLLQRVDEASSLRPRALVLVPTRELALQVTEVLEPLAQAIGKKVISCYGGSNIDKQIKALKDGVEVVVGTPGRLIDLGDRKAIDLSEVTGLVLDEADRMADMGFMPQVEWLLRRMPRERQTLLFSATLDGDVDHLVRHFMHDPVRHEVESPQATVDQMVHRFLKVHQMDKPKVAAAIARHQVRTLVFVRTKRGADRLEQQLNREGVETGAIHGDLRQSQREKALAAFTAGKLPILVATDVAARGIHVDGIDVVIHYDPPEDHKAYLHRSGRTARAGESGVVVTLMLYNEENDINRLQKRLGLREPIVEVFSNDARLADLTTLAEDNVSA